MALRELLTSSQREALEAVPLDRPGLLEHDVLSDQDLSLIRRRRGAQNRLGLAVQLALLRYPGRALLPGETPPTELLTFVARQLGLSAGVWTSYAGRDETRREHLAELQLHFGLRSFGIGHYRSLATWLMPTALQTNHGVVLVRAAIEVLRRRSVVVPRLAVLERLCAEVIVRSERQMFETLTTSLSDGQRHERQIGRIERSLFVLEWMKDPELRRRIQVGLDKGEARNALARAVFFNRQGDLRDRSFENQRYHVSGLNLIVAPSHSGIPCIWNVPSSRCVSTASLLMTSP